MQKQILGDGHVQCDHSYHHQETSPSSPRLLYHEMADEEHNWASLYVQHCSILPNSRRCKCKVEAPLKWRVYDDFLLTCMCTACLLLAKL
jgi:hypothetical protein